MKNFVKETTTRNLRPFKTNNIQIMYRYSIFKSLFKKNKAYTIFAEPDFSFINKKIIKWYSEFNSESVSYNDVNDDEKLRINKLLKNQVKLLYNYALYIHENSTDNDKIFETLDKAIEVPDLSDINILKDNNRIKIVLTRWGAISDEYNAKKGIIKNLVPVKIKDITFNLKYNDGTPALDKELFFRLNELVTNYKTDNNGKIVLFDIPFWQIIEVWHNNENFEKVFKNKYKCSSKDQYTIIIPKEKIFFDMRFIIHNESSIPEKNREFSITIDNSSNKYKTNSNGEFILNKIEEKKKVYCSVDDNGNIQKFGFLNDGRSYYILKLKTKKVKVEPISKEKPIEEKVKKEEKPIKETVTIVTQPTYSTDTDRKLRVIYNNNSVVKGAKVFFSNSSDYLKTDINGELQFQSNENSLINIKIKKNYRVTKIDLFITNQKEYVIKINSKKRILLYLILSLIPLLAILFYFILFSNAKVEKYTHKVFISGCIVSDNYVREIFSEIFVDDEYSITVKKGVYNINDILPEIKKITLDGLVIGIKTRLILYSDKNGHGNILVDTVGPLIINCKRWRYNKFFNISNSKKYKKELQNIFPLKKRMWSTDTLMKYNNGSIKVLYE